VQRDLFNGATHPIAAKYDLFAGAPVDMFRWCVCVFSGDGAIQAISKTNKRNLLTYYPIRFNSKGEPIPLWRNYLLVEFREYVTIEVCREVPKFIQMLSAHDDDGILRPILVKRNAIDENKAMVLAGKYNERQLIRKFYGRGSIIHVLEGNFIGKKVRLDEDVLPEWHGNHRVKVDLDGVKATVELYKLSL
jgi:hypothetical protein